MTAAGPTAGDGGPPLLVERQGDVLVITFNRPAVRNAINLEMASGVAEALDDLDASPDLRVGIITGAGGTFSAGMDLKAFLRGEVPVVPERGFAGVANRTTRKPLIAAVEGFAFGGGLEVVLACDLVTAAGDARFGIPEARRGLIAGAGGLIRLPKHLPHHVAMELALTGQPLLAPRAAELGLVNRLTEPGGALAAALGLAAEVARCAPLACEASKRIIIGTTDWTEEEAWRRQSEIAGALLSSDDAAEGARAFTEKREPVWRGV